MSIKKLIDNWGHDPEERAALKKMAEEVNAEAAKRWEDPNFRREVAALLTESILEGFELVSFLPQIISTRTVGMHDREFIKEVTGLKVFYIAKGGVIEASRLVTESLEISRDTLAFKVYEFSDKMESGFAESMAELRNLAVRRMDWAVNAEMLKLLQASINATTNPAFFITGAGLSQAGLNQAIREVRDQSVSGVITLLGRSTMVDQIADFTGFADEALEEIRQRGRLGVYRGASVVQVRNYEGGEGEDSFPDDELWVVSQDAGRFVHYGGLKAKEWEDNEWYWWYQGRRDMGGIVTRPERLRRIQDTSV